MPLDLSSKTSVAATRTIAYCDRLPPDERYVAVPRPEAGAFQCPHPCGQPCRLEQPALFRLTQLRRHACHLQLRQTLEQLTEAAMQPEPPLACDLGTNEGRPACGPLHLN